MLTAKVFTERWGDDPDDPLVKLDASHIEMPEDARSFLRDAGLPSDAAPFLSFGGIPGVPSLTDVYGLGPEFAHFHCLGSDGVGDPICIDSESNGCVVVLDHETRFDRTTFMNSSVVQLAASLLAYRQMVSDSREQNGDDACLDGDIPPAVKSKLIDDLMLIDPAAMKQQSYWCQAVSELEPDAGW